MERERVGLRDSLQGIGLYNCEGWLVNSKIPRVGG